MGGRLETENKGSISKGGKRGQSVRYMAEEMEWRMPRGDIGGDKAMTQVRSGE